MSVKARRWYMLVPGFEVYSWGPDRGYGISVCHDTHSSIMEITREEARALVAYLTRMEAKWENEGSCSEEVEA